MGWSTEPEGASGSPAEGSAEFCSGGGKARCRAERLLVDTKLRGRRKHVLAAKKANSLLGCISQRAASTARELILPLCSAVLRHIWVAVPSAGLLVQERHGLPGVSPVKGHRDDEETGASSVLASGRLRELGLASLEQRRLRGNLINVFNFLWEGVKKMLPDSSQRCPVNVFLLLFFKKGNES